MQKLSIVTGASSGIGRAICRTLVNHGYPVLGISRNIEKLQTLKAINPEKIQILEADLSSEQDLLNIINQVGNTPIQFLVHNAATLGPTGDLKDVQLKDFKKTLAINLEAPFFLTKSLTPNLKNNGRVLHISSGFAHMAPRGLASYCISKAAFYKLYECFKSELQEDAIAISSLIPGVVDTPMQETLRSLTEKQFPEVKTFISLKEKNKLYRSSMKNRKKVCNVM